MKKNLLGVIDDEALSALRKRNQKRADLAKEMLGSRYAFNPANHVKRKSEFTPSAGALARLGVM